MVKCKFIQYKQKVMKNTYRPEIDGLRALAVLSVIFFHAGIKLFKGGFVGVDIFFVISGYLITTIILKDIEKEKFSIPYFYQRSEKDITCINNNNSFERAFCFNFSTSSRFTKLCKKYCFFFNFLVKLSIFLGNWIFCNSWRI